MQDFSDDYWSKIKIVFWRNTARTTLFILATSLTIGLSARLGLCDGLEVINTILPDAKSGQAILRPLVSGQNKKIYDADFRKLYDDAKNGTVDDKVMTAQLFVRKATDNEDNPEMRRCLLLGALQLSQSANTEFRTQEKIYLDLLPLLQEDTIAVWQARADTLASFSGKGAGDNGAAEPIYVGKAYLLLGDRQFEVGQFEEALGSLHASETWAKKDSKEYADLKPILTWQISRANEFVELRKILKTNPDDPVPNTRLAILYLAHNFLPDLQDHEMALVVHSI